MKNTAGLLNFGWYRPGTFEETHMLKPQGWTSGKGSNNKNDFSGYGYRFSTINVSEFRLSSLADGEVVRKKLVSKY